MEPFANFWDFIEVSIKSIYNVDFNGWRLMPPTLELVFTRSPYALKTIQRQCHLCLCVLTFLHPRKDLWGAHGDFLEHWGPFSCPEHTFFSFWATFWDCLGHLGVPGWSGAGFMKILGHLWSALWTSIFEFFVKKVIVACFFLELLLYFFWGGFLIAFAWMFWSPET